MTAWIATYTGKKFHFDNPRGCIDIRDIAHGLANSCRFAGQSPRFYSVAQHSCLLHDYVKLHVGGFSLMAAALLHDSSEAYIGDLPKPLKEDGSVFSLEYKKLEQKIMDQVCVYFGLSNDDMQSIKYYDNRILGDESVALFSNNLTFRDWDPVDRLRIDIWSFWNPDEAEEEFLKRFNLLWTNKGSVAQG